MKRSLATGWILPLSWLVACAQAGSPPQVRGSSAPAWILWPVEGKVSSAYGNPRGGAGKHHRGIDIRTQPGTPIRASAAGPGEFQRTHARLRQHRDVGAQGGFETRYAHNRKNLVEEGDWVGT